MPPHDPSDFPADNDYQRGRHRKKRWAAIANASPVTDFFIPGGAEFPPGPGPGPARKWPRAVLAVAACGALFAGAYTTAANLQPSADPAEASGPDPTLPPIPPPTEMPAFSKASLTAKTTVRSAEAPEPPPPSPEPEPPAEEPPPSDDKAEEETDPEERIRAWIEDYYDCPDRESKGEDYWQDEDHRNSHGGESAHH